MGCFTTWTYNEKEEARLELEGIGEPHGGRTVEKENVSAEGTHGPQGQRGVQKGKTVGTSMVLTATPDSPLPLPGLSIHLPVLSPQIETSQLEPEIARATSSRTVVYNKGL